MRLGETSRITEPVKLLCCGMLLSLLAADIAWSQQADPAKIAGPNACAECHKEEAAAWQETHHFSTFRRMPRSKKAKAIAKKMGVRRIRSESVCLNCHFTSKPGKRRPKPIAGISCESCHSPGKDWIKVHSGFSGKTEETESQAEEQARWKKAESLGMIRPRALYKLARNCYSCHVVPQEDLVNVGGHPAGSTFELVSWSQGEVRHNTWYSKGKGNLEAEPARKRMMYVVGLAVELEISLRAIGEATANKPYAVIMAYRADRVRKKLAAAAEAVPEASELAEIATLGHSAGLKLDNNAALSAAADKIAERTRSLVAHYDGSGFGALDKLIPPAGQYKGKARP